MHVLERQATDKRERNSGSTSKLDLVDDVAIRSDLWDKGIKLNFGIQLYPISI